jgi:hypothetical protein
MNVRVFSSRKANPLLDEVEAEIWTTKTEGKNPKPVKCYPMGSEMGMDDAMIFNILVAQMGKNWFVC